MRGNAQVIVCYGPYESCGLVKHRTFRLEGLQALLKEHGHQFILEETAEWNTVELVVHGECVYTCDIRQMEFGGDGKLDPRCKEAISAVDDAY